MYVELFNRLTVLVALGFTLFGGVIMFEVIMARFFARSVDQLVAQLDRLETKLVTLAQRKLDEALQEEGLADVLNAQVVERLDAAETLRVEAQRAMRIANRVGQLTE